MLVKTTAYQSWHVFLRHSILSSTLALLTAITIITGI